MKGRFDKKERTGFMIKKILLTISAFLFLILAGCATPRIRIEEDHNSTAIFHIQDNTVSVEETKILEERVMKFGEQFGFRYISVDVVSNKIKECGLEDDLSLIMKNYREKRIVNKKLLVKLGKIIEVDNILIWYAYRETQGKDNNILLSMSFNTSERGNNNKWLDFLIFGLAEAITQSIK